MRLLSLLLVLGLAATAFLLPEPSAPEPGPSAGIQEPSVAVCAVEEGAGRTTEIPIVSTVDGPTQLTLFTGGVTAGSIGRNTGPSGSAVIPIVDVAAVGTVGALVEMPNTLSAAASVVTGSASMSGETCGTVPAPSTLITGGSTASGKTFVLHLMNPYAGDALVELGVESETGTESNDRFESVIVPSRSSKLVDFTDLIPGRESISVAIETIDGRVMAVGRQGVDGGSAVWNAVEPAQDWFVPVPSGAGVKQLLITTSADSDVDFQIDLYAEDQFEEGFVEGTVPATGAQAIDVAEVSEETLGLRVVSAGPVVATLVIDTEDGIAASNGSRVAANRWFLPGASNVDGGRGHVVILNTGIDEDSVSVRALRDDGVFRVYDVPSDGVVQISLEMADGYLVESTGPIVVSWTASRPGASMLSSGFPLIDG